MTAQTKIAAVNWRSAGEILTCVMLGIALTLLLGKDANWDTLNYHYYTAHAYFYIPLNSDFMGASAQRYLNPIGFVPFFLMVSAGWHSAVIGAMLGAFHGLALFFLWRICRDHLFQPQTTLPFATALLATALGALSPVFLGVLGSTFVDPSATVFILAGALLMLRSFDGAGDARRILFFAGLLLGVGTGLKLTNVIFAASLVLAFLPFNTPFGNGFRKLCLLIFGGVIGLLATSGLWFYALYEEFGNPVFPLLNHVFRSPDFSTDIATHTRFKVLTLLEAVTLPLRMASVHSWIYVENAAPDLRFALILLTVVLLAANKLLALGRRLTDRNGRAQNTQKISALVGGASYKQPYFFLAFASMYCLWQFSSGNGRYALPVLLFAGPVLVLVLLRFGLKPRTFFFGLSSILVLQALNLFWNGNPRWGNEPWKANWLEITTTPTLTNEPFGYLTLGVITHSASVIVMHKDSRFLNLVGAHSIRADGPGNPRVRKFIETHGARLRVMFEVQPGSNTAGSVQGPVDDVNGVLSPWDLRIVNGTCEPIRIHHLRPKGYELAACLVTSGNPVREQMERARNEASGIMNRVEAACPLLFSPKNPLTIHKGGIWQREYINNDIRLMLYRGKLAYSKLEYGPFDVPLGGVDEWIGGRGKIDCSMPPRPFAF